MTKRIIVEGPDGSGKSTLIDKLVLAYPTQLIEEPGFRHSGYDHYLEWLQHELNIGWDWVPVHNRFLYSELIYGPILRKKLAVSMADAMSVKLMLEKEAFLIYCTLSYDKLVENATNSEQHDGVLENLREIYHTYQDVMALEMIPYSADGRCTTYNYEIDSLSNLVQAVGEYLNS